MKKSSKGRMKQKIYSQNISLSRTQMTNNHPIGSKKKILREPVIQGGVHTKKMSLTILLNLKNEIKKVKNTIFTISLFCVIHI